MKEALLTAAARHHKRLHFIDAARALAVAAAMFSHFMRTFGPWERDYTSALRFLFQVAPPLFILMFGMMLEVVYVPRIASVGLSPVARRLARRSFQCWLGLAATAVAALVAGQFTAGGALLSLAMIKRIPLSNILTFYVIALLLAVPLLALRRRFGTAGILVLLAMIWSTYPVLVSIESPEGWWQVPLGILTGVIGRPMGPSVLFGSTFVIVGMTAAAPLHERFHQGFGPFFRRVTILMIIAAAVTAIAVAIESPEVVARNFSEYRSFRRVYRSGNHPGYYAAGVLLSLALLVFLAGLLPRDRPLPAWVRWPFELGRSALLAFSLGNVALILAPPVFRARTLAGAVAGALLFVVALTATLHAVDVARRRLSGKGVVTCPSAKGG